MAATYRDTSGSISGPAADPFAELRLTEWTKCGGCAAKLGASMLTDLVGAIPEGVDPALLVGLAPFDLSLLHISEPTRPY